MSPTPGAARLATRPEVRTIRDLLGKPDKSLADYHAAGEQLRQLAADEAVAGAPGWRRAVAEVLGRPGLKSTLDKCLQLRTTYPTRADLRQLADIEGRWSFVLTALAVPDKAARHDLLRAARQERWSGARLRACVQAANGSARGGGRPKARPAVTGLAPDLHHLLSLLEDLAVFLDAVWARHAPRVAKLRAPAAAAAGVNARRVGVVLDRIHGLPEQVRAAVEQLARLGEQLTPAASAAPGSR